VRAVAAALWLAAGCVGTMEEKFPLAAGPGPDGAACDEALVSGDDGHHKPGEPCLTCHAAGGDGPAFTVGGTLYEDLAGTATLADATVHVVDADGQDLALPVAANGNFWTAAPLAFPIRTHASMCPDTNPMLSPLDASGGDCNKAGCHAAGFRVALP
jgi:hypothetical protein